MQIAIDPIHAGVLPLTPAGAAAMAAASALARGAFLLAPVGIPEDPPLPDIPGARECFREAVHQLEQALQHATGKPGRAEIELALAEAQEGLWHLQTPGITPPVVDVLEHAWQGGELARKALAMFENPPIVGPPA